MVTIAEVEKLALDLPDSERAVLAAHLLRSLPSVLHDEDEGIAEALRRDADFDANLEQLDQQIAARRICLPIRTMMRSHFLWIIFFVGSLSVVRAAESPSVELQLRDKPVALTEPAQQQLRLQALQLLETSNFHSGVGDTHHIFNLPDIQRDYRTTVAGKFLLVSFPTPQKIITVGGEITVTQIIVGLNRDEYASSLFTIDESGIVVGHSKYSGERCIDILKAVKQLQP